MRSQQTFESPLYRSFKAIEGDSYRSILRFVEDHSTDISQLPVPEYFDLQYAYVAALYETAGYQRVVDLTHELLELSIAHDLREVGGEDAYRSLLFRRASSLFRLARFGECAHVTDQLLRLYPNFRAASLLYEKALYQKPNAWLARARALSVVLFLAAAAVIAAELLVVRHLLPDHTEWVELTRNLCFLLGWVLLLGADLGHRAVAYLAVRRRRARAQRRRAARAAREA